MSRLWRSIGSRVPHPLRGYPPPARILRQIAGMPDYVAHVEHLHRCHPERSVPTEREFYEDYLRTRYADGPTRCC